MLDWCDENNVKYIVGIAQNTRLNKLLEPTMKQSNEAFATTKEKQRFFSEFKYKADSWSRQRKIGPILKIEQGVAKLEKMPNYYCLSEVAEEVSIAGNSSNQE
ncbi:transposase [Orientia tsutsugamushi]|uniref:transposase n=1 Tax=Orientia tsutsugamushi TaxID=784 RepID=UPI003528B00E